MREALTLTQDEILELLNSNKRLHIKLADAVVENNKLKAAMAHQNQEAVPIYKTKLDNKE